MLLADCRNYKVTCEMMRFIALAALIVISLMSHGDVAVAAGQTGGAETKRN